MCEITREELIAYNNLRESRLENEKLKEELKEARFAVEHNNNLVNEERLKHELYRKDGEISALRFALRYVIDGCRGKGVLDETD